MKTFFDIARDSWEQTHPTPVVAKVNLKHRSRYTHKWESWELEVGGWYFFLRAPLAENTNSTTTTFYFFSFTSAFLCATAVKKLCLAMLLWGCFVCLLESGDIEVEKITLAGNQQLIDGVVRALSMELLLQVYREMFVNFLSPPCLNIEESVKYTHTMEKVTL
jgi:hypothetical protein